MRSQRQQVHVEEDEGKQNDGHLVYNANLRFEFSLIVYKYKFNCKSRMKKLECKHLYGTVLPNVNFSRIKLFSTTL